MGSGGNGGNFFNPKNLVPAVLTGGLSYGLNEIGKNMKPQAPPTPSAPPDPGPAPIYRASETGAETAAQRQKKLAAMQFGFASTMTNKAGSSAAPLSTPTAQPLKMKMGQ